MSRAIRRVPADWEHPKDASGRYVPLLGRDFQEELVDWLEQNLRWDEGYIRTYDDKEWEPRSATQAALDCETFVEWHGERPQREEYMPKFSPGIATHYQMYEETTEGTPISPVFATPEELARWLTDNGANAGWGAKNTYEEWLGMCRPAD